MRVVSARHMRTAPATAANRSASLDVGGRNRTYLVHVPPGYDGKAPLPLVFLLHGGGQSRKPSRPNTMTRVLWSSIGRRSSSLARFTSATSLPSRTPFRGRFRASGTVAARNSSGSPCVIGASRHSFREAQERSEIIQCGEVLAARLVGGEKQTKPVSGTPKRAGRRGDPPNRGRADLRLTREGGWHMVLRKDQVEIGNPAELLFYAL